jgi:hypothetical protein
MLLPLLLLLLLLLLRLLLSRGHVITYPHPHTQP